MIDGEWVDGPIIRGPIIGAPERLAPGVQPLQSPSIEPTLAPQGSSTRNEYDSGTSLTRDMQSVQETYDDQRDDPYQSPQDTQPRETRQENVNIFSDEESPAFENKPLDLRIDVPEDPEAILPIEDPSFDTDDFGVSFDVSDEINPTVTEVVIDPLASHAENVDRLPGDDGLVLLVQPRSSNGDVIPAAGEMTVSIIDPKQYGHRQRIGLWKFTPDETSLFIADGRSGDQGIVLRLPWEKSTPKNNRLRAFVRFITEDGRRLETSTDFEINPPTVEYSADAPLVEQWVHGSPATRLPNRRSPMQTVSGSRSIINRPSESDIDLDSSEWIPSRTPHMLQNRTSEGQPEVRRKRIKPPEWKPVR